MPLGELLPRTAVVVADAGYCGFDVARPLLATAVSFLIRLSANGTLYTKERVALERFREGLVDYCPRKTDQQSEPLRLRLLRVRGKKKQPGVWLWTSVLESQRWPAVRAARFYTLAVGK